MLTVHISIPNSPSGFYLYATIHVIRACISIDLEVSIVISCLCDLTPKDNLNPVLELHAITLHLSLFYGPRIDKRCLRRNLGIKWFHRVRNTTVRERTGQIPASLLLKTRRLKWFGHVSRMGQERLPKALSRWRPENAKRRRGRCRTRWKDAVERDARLAGLDQDLESMASDRAKWRDMLAL